MFSKFFIKSVYIVWYIIFLAKYILLIKSRENCVYVSINIFKALIESLEKYY